VPGAPPITFDGAEGIELAERRDSMATGSALEKADLDDEEVGAQPTLNLNTKYRQRTNKAIQRSVLLQALTQRASLISSIFLLL